MIQRNTFNQHFCLQLFPFLHKHIRGRELNHTVPLHAPHPYGVPQGVDLVPVSIILYYYLATLIPAISAAISFHLHPMNDRCLEFLNVRAIRKLG